MLEPLRRLPELDLGALRLPEGVQSLHMERMVATRARTTTGARCHYPLHVETLDPLWEPQGAQIELRDPPISSFQHVLLCRIAPGGGPGTHLQ